MPWEGRGARHWLGDQGWGGLRARGSGSLRVWVSRRMPSRKTLLQVQYMWIPGHRSGAPQLAEEQEGPHVCPPSCKAGLRQANQECCTSSYTATHLCWSQGCHDEQRDTVISQSGAPGPCASKVCVGPLPAPPLLAALPLRPPHPSGWMMNRNHTW